MPEWQLPPPVRHVRTAVLDYDADGLVDLLENWRGKDTYGGLGEVVEHHQSLAMFFNRAIRDGSVPDTTFVELLYTGWNQDVGFLKAADVDGDGNTDLFGEHQGVFYGSGMKNRMLTRVVDGLGNVTTITYDQFGTYQRNPTDISLPPCEGTWPEICLPKVTGLVSQHQDGFLDGNNQTQIRKTAGYRYFNARVNVTGHGFLGFDRRVVVESSTPGASQESEQTVQTVTIDAHPIVRVRPDGVRTTDTKPPYLYPFAGLPSTITTDAKIDGLAVPIAPISTGAGHFRRRTRVTNAWEVGVSQSGLPFPRIHARTTQTFDRERPFEIGAPTPDTEDGTLITQCAETFTTDGYGNALTHVNSCFDWYGRLIESTTTNNTYDLNATDWLISNPKTTSSKSWRSGFTHTREYLFTYDSRGLLETVTRGIHEANGTPDDETAWHRKSFGRNAFGNPEQILEEVLTGAARPTTIEYDEDQIFPWRITNSLAQTTQVSFDPGFGNPATLIDPNHRIVQNAYDGMGLLTEVRDPTGLTVRSYSPSSTIQRDTAAGPIYPRIQVTSDRQGIDGTPTGGTLVEVDHLGRPVLIQSKGFGGTDVIQERAYDFAGRLVAETLPHTLGTSDVPVERYRYDGLYRLTDVRHADGSSVKYQHASVASLGADYQHWLRELDCRMLAERPLAFSGCPVEIQRTIDETAREDVVISDHAGQVIRNIDGENTTTTAQFSDYNYGPFNLPHAAYQNRSTVNDWQNPTFEYERDHYGRITKLVDGDTGGSTRKYNGYDELIRTEDPKQQVRWFAHDALGRVIRITDDSGVSEWIYDQGQNALGRLSETISPPTSENPDGQRISYTYEPFTAGANRGLLARIDHFIDGESYPVDLDYDGLGRTRNVHYPNPGEGQPIVARYQYDPAGTMTGVQEVGSGTVRSVWQINQAYQGHLIQAETFGNGASTTYAYDPARRWLQSIETELGSDTLQSLGYDHYDNGQVSDLMRAGAATHYDYDALNRLKTVTDLAGGAEGITDYTYDRHGNMSSKGITAIAYQPTQPHLVASVGDNMYVHDANGNVESRTGPDVPGGIQFFDYTSFDLPRGIQTGPSARTSFDYSADETRLVRRDHDPANPTEDRTRIFVPDLYQRLLDANGDTVEERFQISAGGRPIAEIVRTTSGDETLYLHTDRLGSAETITTSTGQTFEQRFDPFGAPDPTNTTITRAGYTGHAHDTDLGLIDMKGRVYDPLASRFTTADPLMQAPYWSQGMNRYAYVFNDPINATDPSGFISMSDVVKGFVYGGHIAAAGLFAVGSITSGNAPTTNFAAVGGLTGGSSALTMPGLLQGQAGSGPAVVEAPLTIPPAPGLCSSGHCVAQNAGDPSTGAHGQGNLSADIPAQPTAGDMADFVSSVYPTGRGARAAEKIAAKAGWFERAVTWIKGLFRAGPTAEKALVDANKLNHIFGKPAHNLGPLVEKFGSQEATFNAVQNATQTVVKSRGITGVFETTVNVGGQNVVVRGNVIEDTARIGTFFIP